MKWITILAFLCLDVSSSYASLVRTIDTTQHEEPNNNNVVAVQDERQLTDELRQVQWNLVVIMLDGSTFNPDETWCTEPGFRNQPKSFYKFVHDVATVIGQDYLQKHAAKRGLSADYTVWNVEKVNDRQVGRRLQDEHASRSLLTGFVFKLVVSCRLCNPDNKDGRRLGSSNGGITSLADNVAKVMYGLMRKRCGVPKIVEVTFEMVNN
jgi:hypothetical protein